MTPAAGRPAGPLAARDPLLQALEIASRCRAVPIAERARSEALLRGRPPAPVSTERCPRAHPGRAASRPACRRGSHQPGGGAGALHHHEDCQGPPEQCFREAPGDLSCASAWTC